MQYHLSQTPIIFSPIKIGHKNFHEGLDIRKKQDQLKCEYSVYAVSSSFQEMLWISRVVAHLWNKGKESVLEYKMSLVDGKWKAWDLVIDDLSTARNYKDQFSQILKTKSFAELIDIISKKADESEK